MGTILLCIIKGTVYGIFGGGCLVAACFANDFQEMGSAILDFNFDELMSFDWTETWSIFFPCIVGGAVLGLFYGIYKIRSVGNIEKDRRAAENTAEARKRRVNWASEVKRKALNANITCAKNQTFDTPLASATYKANTQMAEIMNELTRVAEKQGIVDSLADELTKKGGGAV